MPKTAVFLGYRSIKSSWLNKKAKVGSKIVFSLVACVFKLASKYKHSPFCASKVKAVQLFGWEIRAVSILSSKSSRIATNDLEYKALLTDYGEYADNLVNISSIFLV